MSTSSHAESGGRVFDGIRVVDLSETRAGAYCTKLLAGFGAEVIKVEPPGGDALRRQGPLFRDGEGRDHSVPALWYHTGKKSIVLDWRTESGRSELRSLMSSADVVVESFRPGTMDGWELGYETLRADHPALILTSVTPFGQTGPYRDFEAEEITCYALSGAMKLTGDPAREPLNSGSNACHSIAGMWAYLATLMALFQRHRTGNGQWIDVSIHECAVDCVEIHFANHLQHGKIPNRNSDQHFMAPWENYPCKDGHVTIVSSPVRHWFRAADMFEAPALKTSRFFTARDRMEHRTEVAELMAPWLHSHTRKEVFEAGQRNRQCFGMLQDLREALDIPQHRDRQFFREVGHPTLGPVPFAGYPFRGSASEYHTEAAPEPGKHTHRIDARARPPVSAADPTPADPTGGPLAGIRVLDFSTHWASPHTTRILADSGAEVIVVEFTGLLCLFRGARINDQGYNDQPSWQAINRNKKSITLDLREEHDLDIVRELIATCDIVVENSRTGVMDRLGLGYKALRAIRADIILLSLTGYGSTGPWATHSAMGAAIESTSGIQSLTGYRDASKRYRVKELDICSGTMGACAIMTALLERMRTGRGQHLDVSMMESATHAQIGEFLLFTALTGSLPPALGNRDHDHAPQGVYPCRGEDAWVAVTIRDQAEWHQLCDLIGRPDWKSDPDLKDADGRRARHDAIDDAIRDWTGGLDPTEVMMTLQQQGIPAGAVLSLAELAVDPHVQGRGLIVHPECGGDDRYTLPPIRMSDAVMRIRHHGPDLGDHNREIIHERLGRPVDDVPTIDANRLVSAYFPFPEDRPVDAGETSMPPGSPPAS